MDEIEYTANTKVLYVDDEVNLLSSFTSLMRKEKIQVFTLNTSNTIDDVLLKDGPFAVVLSDQRMPGLDGVAVLERVAMQSESTERILVTGFSDHADTTRAINLGGITRYVPKPWNDEDLKKIVRDGVARYNLKGHNRYLLGVISSKNHELVELLDGTVTQTVTMLSEMIGAVTPKGAEHVDRLRKLGTAVLKLLPPISETERWNILRAFDLYDLGLTMLPAWILISIEKDGLNAVDRFPAARNHHLLAARMLNDSPRLDGIARIIRCSHKNFSGSGEPINECISGTDIPLGSRIIRILIDIEKKTTQHFRERDVLKSMTQYPNTYDVEIIRTMLGQTPPKLTHTDMTIVVSELRPGMVMLQDVVSQSGHRLMNAYSSISESGLKMLLEWHQDDPIKEPIRVRKLY
jgi:response regulator RpfG family c-di-GMP phosphodiesterase